MRKPNILIFMTDQQRGSTIPPYSRAKTPNLDNFCREGVTFSNAYTVAPHCCPSRATFFSGLYPSQHGVWNNVGVGNTLSRGLYEGVRLFSEDLGDAGYDLYFSGKWHVSDVESPLDRGFDVMNVPAPTPREEYRHRRPHTREWEQYTNIHEQTERNEGQILRSGYATYTHYGEKENPFNDREVTDDAVGMILSRKQTDTPWCQFVGTLGPHDPYFVPEKYLDLYKPEDITLPDNFGDTMADKPALYRRTRDRFDQLSEAEHREAIRHYLAFCSYEDALFGEVLDALESSNQAENTLVIYLSDHGDYMGDHGLWCKGLPCFRGAYHIPAVIRWPAGLIQPGRIQSELITLADFAPTFLEAAGIAPDREFMGQSLMPWLQNEKPAIWQDALYTQSNGNELYGIQRSVTTKEWKYVYNGFDYDELYNLAADPGETVNLAGDPAYDGIIREMCKKIWAFARCAGDVCVNQYIMVGLAPYGPGVAFEDEA